MSICWANVHTRPPAYKMKPANQRRRRGLARCRPCTFWDFRLRLSFPPRRWSREPGQTSWRASSWQALEDRVLWCSCPFMSTSDSESAEDQVLAKCFGGWRFPAALKHITQGAACQFQEWKSGCDLCLLSHSSSCFSSSGCHLKLVVFFRLIWSRREKVSWQVLDQISKIWNQVKNLQKLIRWCRFKFGLSIRAPAD